MDQSPPEGSRAEGSRNTAGAPGRAAGRPHGMEQGSPLISGVRVPRAELRGGLTRMEQGSLLVSGV